MVIALSICLLVHNIFVYKYSFSINGKIIFIQIYNILHLGSSRLLLTGPRSEHITLSDTGAAGPPAFSDSAHNLPQLVQGENLGYHN